MSHKLRALAVLQRDLTREKQRIEDEQRALKAKEEAEKKAAGTRKQATPEPEIPEASLPSSSPLSNTPLGRRPSSISISSLHRPSLPGKLDLSSASFRLSQAEDSQSFQTGLASPVLLAPKSARPLGPNELPSDFLSTFGSSSSDLHRADIDLTIPAVMRNGRQGTINLTAGDSNDKPIELDMDIDMNIGLFGDGPESAQASRQEGDDLFSPSNDPSLVGNFLGDAHGDNILSTFAGGAPSDGNSGPNIKQEEGVGMPSPGSLLASFPSPAHQGQSDDQQQFDFGSLSLDMFSNGQHSADMDFSAMDFAMDDQSNQQNSLAENEGPAQSAEPSKAS